MVNPCRAAKPSQSGSSENENSPNCSRPSSRAYSETRRYSVPPTPRWRAAGTTHNVAETALLSSIPALTPQPPTPTGSPSSNPIQSRQVGVVARTCSITSGSNVIQRSTSDTIFETLAVSSVPSINSIVIQDSLGLLKLNTQPTLCARPSASKQASRYHETGPMVAVTERPPGAAPEA